MLPILIIRWQWLSRIQVIDSVQISHRSQVSWFIGKGEHCHILTCHRLSLNNYRWFSMWMRSQCHENTFVVISVASIVAILVCFEMLSHVTRCTRCWNGGHWAPFPSSHPCHCCCCQCSQSYDKDMVELFEPFLLGWACQCQCCRRHYFCTDMSGSWS